MKYAKHSASLAIFVFHPPFNVPYFQYAVNSHFESKYFQFKCKYFVFSLEQKCFYM